VPITTAQSKRLVDDLVALARTHGGVSRANEKLRALQEVAPPEAAELIDQIVTSHEGRAADRIEAAKVKLAKVLRETDTTDWSQIGGGLQSSSTGRVLEVRKSAISDTVFIEGALSKDAEGYVQLKAGGQAFQIIETPEDRLVPYPAGRSIEPEWVTGMLGENVVIRGKISDDGKSIVMDGFTFKPKGRPDWETFTPCRVASRVGGDVAAIALMNQNKVPADVTAILSTPDGIAYIKDPEVAKQLSVLPKLACMLPGEPTREADGKLVYRLKPKDLNIFLRVMAPPTDNQFPADTAMSHFESKPVTVPPDVAARVKIIHEGQGTETLWALGTFGFNKKTGEAESFKASWVGGPTEAYSARLRPADPIDPLV
jgi:hypothetical protein